MSDEIEVLTLTQIKKLKVAELRDRLQSLGKPTTGLKPELVNRLFEALFEAQKKEAYKMNLAAACQNVGDSGSVAPQNTAEPVANAEPIVESVGDTKLIDELKPSLDDQSTQDTQQSVATEDSVSTDEKPLSVEAEQPITETLDTQQHFEAVSVEGKDSMTEMKTETTEPITETLDADQSEAKLPTVGENFTDTKEPQSETLDNKEPIAKLLTEEKDSTKEPKTETIEAATEPLKIEQSETTLCEEEKISTDAEEPSKEAVDKVEPVLTLPIEERDIKESTDVKESASEAMDSKPPIATLSKEDFKDTKEAPPESMDIQHLDTTVSTERRDSTDTKEAPKPQKERKRRWGSSLSSNNSGVTPPKTTKGISSDAIKALIPDLNKSNAQVSNKTDDIKKDSKITPTNTTLQNSTNVSGIGQSNSGTTANRGTNGIKSVDKHLQKSHSVNEDLDKQHQQQHEEEKDKGRRLSTSALSMKNGKNEDASESIKRAPSPAHNPPTNIVFIRNLVRPFTLLQLKEILGKSGKLVEEKFWIDKIKSKCYVTYKSQEEAVIAREALHGLKWPDANPKNLIADFATEDELEYHLNLEKGATAPPATTEAAAKSDLKRPSDLSKPTSKDKYDIIIRREKHDGQGDVHTVKSDDRIDVRKEKREELNRDKRPIREWDREKLLKKSEGDSVSPVKRKRSVSRSNSPRRGEETKSKEKEKSRESNTDQKQKEKLQESESPANLLDGLFKKTKTTPCIYWLPLTEEQAKKRAEERIEAERRRNEERIARESERRKRIEEMNRARRPSPPPRRDPISPGRRGGRGSYASRRPPPRFRSRRGRSDSDSDSSSRSRSRSRSRGRSGRSISRSRSRSRSPPPRKGPPPRRTRTRSRTPRRTPRRR